MIIIPVLNLIYIRHLVVYKIRLKIEWGRIISYIKFGFPIYVTSILTMLLNSMDRVMIVSMLGIKQLGFYSIALMAKNYSAQLSANLSHVTSPHFLEDFGRHGDTKKLIPYLLDGTFAIAAFMSVIIGFMFIFSFPLIKTVLPSFLPGLTALRIYLLTSLFASLVVFPENFIVTLEKQARLIPFTVVALVMNLVLNYVLIKRGYGISGAAVATAMASFAYLAMISVYGLKHLAGAVRIPYFFLKVFSPCVYSAGVILLLEKYVSCPSMWGGSFIKAGIFLVASVMTAMILQKETGIVGVFMGIVKEGLGKEKNTV